MKIDAIFIDGEGWECPLCKKKYLTYQRASQCCE